MNQQDSATLFGRFMEAAFLTLESWSNVHRGSGFNSQVSTAVLEKARELVIEYFALSPSEYCVIFCSPAALDSITSILKPGSFRTVSSEDIGIPLGIRALAVKKRSLPAGPPPITGGGTTRLYSRNWVIWSGFPARFEAGTPALITIVILVHALTYMKEHGLKRIALPDTNSELASDVFSDPASDHLSGELLLEYLRNNVIGKDLEVPVEKGMAPYIHFDNAASTRTFLPVWNSFRNALHCNETGRKEVVLQVKKICAELLNAPEDEYDIIFTANTTEAINLVAGNPGMKAGGDTQPVILNTILEHSSNDLPWRSVKGAELLRLKVNNEGYWDSGELENLLNEYNLSGKYGRKKISLMAVSGASNVTGTCNDLQITGALAQKYGAFLLVDAAQLVAHKKIDMKNTGIDFLVFSGHKIYAPFGSGVLIARKGLLNYPEKQFQTILDSGEENIGGIAALGKALSLVGRIGYDIIRKEEGDLYRYMVDSLSKITGMKLPGISTPSVEVTTERVPVLLINLNNRVAAKIAAYLNYGSGIGLRYGCHCAHLMVKQLAGFNPVLELIQRTIVLLFPKLVLPGFARLSPGLENTRKEVDILAEELRSYTAAREQHILKSDTRKRTEQMVRERTGKIFTCINE